MSVGRNEAPHARVTALVLRDFRSYSWLDLSLGPGLNMFIGPNGAGKTNLLEAVAYVSLGRSPRTARDADLVRDGTAGFEIGLTYTRVSAAGSGANRPSRLGIRYSPSVGRRASIEGIPAASVAEIYGRVPSVFFCPDDLWLLKGPPAGRRNLLDRLLVQSSPTYAGAVLRYREALAQRNATLQRIRARRASAELLAIWQPQLLQYGVEIFSRRAKAVSAIAPLAAEAYAEISRAPEALQCRYVPGLPDGCRDGVSSGATEWRARFEDALEGRRETDLALGSTSVGPQRDDLEVLLGGRPAARFASQGQQRSAVLAVKLAERAHLRRETGCWPLLLVDDVLSELDAGRRDALAEILEEDGQVFLTTTAAEPLADLPRGQRYQVGGGRVLAERQ